jgi:hypothetical protein
MLCEHMEYCGHGRLPYGVFWSWEVNRLIVVVIVGHHCSIVIVAGKQMGFCAHCRKTGGVQCLL